MQTLSHRILLLLLLAATLLVGHSCTATGETTVGEEDTAQSGDMAAQSGDDECEDYSIDWFVHQYNLRILSLPYLHIGVNISLREAANSHRPQAAFKQLLDRQAPRQMTTEEVCAEIPEHSQQHNDVCPWTYTCSYDPHRFPAYVFRAKCINENYTELTRTPRGRIQPVPRGCREIYYPVPVLRSNGCNPLTSKRAWTWEQENIPVACA